METNDQQSGNEFREYKRLILEKLGSNDDRLAALEKGWPEEQKLVLQTLEAQGEHVTVLENQVQQLLLRIVQIETRCDVRHIAVEKTDKKTKVSINELPWKIIMLLLAIVGGLIALFSKIIDLIS